MMPTLEEVLGSVRAHGLVPIRLLNNPADDDSSYWQFDGELAEFLAGVREMGARGVYIITYIFEQDELTFSPTELEEAEELDDDEVEHGQSEDAERVDHIDLAEVEPRLAPYRARVGELFSVALLALTSESKLRLDLDAAWWSEFATLSDAVVERLEASADAREQAKEAARGRRADEERALLLQELDRLPALPAFRDLRTKGAMVAYVEEKQPAARDVLGARGFQSKMAQLHQRALLERSRR